MAQQMKLKGKYLRIGAPEFMGYPAHARTGNSHSIQNSKRPSLVPCKRNPAGPTGFRPDPQPPLPGVRTRIVDALTGKSRMVWLDAQGKVVGQKFDADAALAKMGLT